MSLRAKLVVVILFVGLVPLLVSAATTFQIHQSAFDETLRTTRKQAAAQVSRTVYEMRSSMLRQFERAALAMPFSTADDAELVGVLRLLFQQDQGTAVVALIDERGDSVAQSIFISAEDQSLHPAGSTSLRAELYKALPPLLAGAPTTVLGKAFTADGDGKVFVPIVVSVEGRSAVPWRVVFAWQIATICAAVEASSVGDTRAMLAERDGRVLCPHPGVAALSPLAAEVQQRLGENAGFSYTGDDGEEYSAITASPSSDWSLIVEQPSALAQAPQKRMFKQSAYWLVAGLIVAVFAGLYLSQGISSRVKTLSEGAQTFAQGELSHRIEDIGGDELGGLASTFNSMATDLQKRQAEIEAWNVTLQDRVDERTRELEAAQKQLLESQKIAAVSSLAAGLAHEINNPLTGVLGLTQLLRGKFARREGEEKTVKSLASVEEQAKRIREIVQELQRMSEDQGGDRQTLGIKPFLNNLTKLIAAQAESAGVEITTEVEEGVANISADANELKAAFMHLLKNALAASSAGDQITITASTPEAGIVKLVISDTGVGIANDVISRVFEPFFTTKSDWGGKGLGLTAAYRIIEQHTGRLTLDSVEGEGTVVSVFLPAYHQGAHLV